MVDSIKREDDLPALDSPDNSGALLAKDLDALSLKQESPDAPIKELKEVPRAVSRTVSFRRGKPKGDTFTLDQFPELLLPCNKFFLAQHDDGRLEIYCWTTPGVNLGHLYRVNPINGALTGGTSATQAFTIGSSTYEPHILNQTLHMRIHSEYQLVDLFLDFQYAQTRYFELAPPDLPSHDLIDPGVELPHLPHDASSQQEISAAGTNASASGTSSAHNGYGIPESDLTSTPMILRVPEGVNPDDPNASDRLYDYTKMFKEEYDKRDDKTLEVSCLHCSRLQKVLRPSSLARHLCRHCEVKDYACDQCVKKCCTQQQLDRHKTNQHGVPAPEPKLVKIKVVKSKVVKSKVVKAKAAKAKAAKGKGAKH